eukprot:255435-Chlamydomonas_euryale.AAC.1
MARPDAVPFLVASLECCAFAVDRAGELSDVVRGDCARLAPSGSRGFGYWLCAGLCGVRGA